MLKILYIVSTLKSGGPTNQLFNIMKNLDRHIFKPIVLTLSSEPKESKWRDYESLGIEMYSLNLSRIEGFIFLESRLKNLIKKIQPDLIHSQGVRADILSSKLNIGIPKISTIRNFPQEDLPMTYGNFLGNVMANRQVIALKRLNLCVGVSDSVSENLTHEFGIDHTFTIWNGVDADTYFPVDQFMKLKLRGTLNLPADAKIWIVSGHLTERKDPFFLIKAWRTFFGEDLKNFLVFIGDGEIKHYCDQLVEGVGNIKILGRVSNVVEYLQASDYYVSASKAEGMPNSALEALSCGLPLLLSDIGPHIELVAVDKKIGFTYEIGVLNSFLSQMIKLIDCDYEVIHSSCLRVVDEHLSANAMSEKYQILYKKYLGKV